MQIEVREQGGASRRPEPDKTFKIIVNAERKEVTKKILTFHDVVELAFPNPQTGPLIVYTVTYKKAVAPQHQGTLIEGGKVEIKNGTIFNVTKTDKS
jgi:hypothetical protein